MAQLGGMGIIHKNLSLEQQAAEVAKVKKFEAGVIRDPITVGPKPPSATCWPDPGTYISGVPVVGSDGQLAGIVTHRDMRFETELDDPVRHIMTKKDRLITVKEGAASDEVLQLLHRNRIEKVLVVNDSFELRGLITVRTSRRIPTSRTLPRICRPACWSALPSAWVAIPTAACAGRRRRGRDRGRYRARPFAGRAGPRQLGQKISRTCKSSVATSAPAKPALALLDSGADAVKVGIGPARSAPPASLPALACRRSPPSTRWPKRCRTASR